MNILKVLVVVSALHVACVIAGQCPNPLDIQDPAVGKNFSLEQFAGHYYELALHDVTQVDSVCGCQTSNKTIVSNQGGQIVNDDFLMFCPKPQVAPSGKIYPSPLSFNVSQKQRGVLLGHWKVLPFTVFPDVVVAVGYPENLNDPYRWVLEFQCISSLDIIDFVGVNFYSRYTTADPRGVVALKEMYAAAMKWGVYNYTGGQSGFTVVNHTGCPQM